MQTRDTPVFAAALLLLQGCFLSFSREPPGDDDTDADTDADTDTNTGPVRNTSIPQEFLGVDRVSPADDGIMPDGQVDYVIDAVVEGPVISLTLLGQETPGVWDSLRGAQWDTIVGNQTIPDEVGTPRRLGSETRVIGVFEGGGMLNRADGSIPTLDVGEHSLRLYASQVGGASHWYQVLAELPDHSIVRGTSINYW